MKPAVLLYKKIPAEQHERLLQHFRVYTADGLDAASLSNLDEILPVLDGIIGAGGKIDREFLQQTPKLRAFSSISVGYDNFDVTALNERRIALMHTPSVLTETVADNIMGLVIASARRFVELADGVKAGEWQASVGPAWFGVDVHHKTIGILGMGRVGMALAQRAHHGFGMSVLYTGRSPKPEADHRFNAQHCELETLLTESDFVCITLPLSPETYHLIGAAQLVKMKKTAVLVNGGRGDVIDEEALISALETRTIFAAGLDVFSKEPLPVSSKLLALPNVIALPHIGSATQETRNNMATCAVDNLIAALSGNIEENCVNSRDLK
ncbi:glyoxylate/hydroxypyruvate reductase GhrB [Rouxiella sp. Mn2063]|uniref:glyoxylate/hydroxypyruvate reductase GhrB n=1 Tax=Rouxiella sp. Mn2063 TaxID=3395262 RepID=UPI003BE10CBB